MVFIATGEEVQSDLARRAAALGFGPRRPSGKSWTYEQVLGAARRRRLKRFFVHALLRGIPMEDVVIDLNQEPKFTQLDRHISCLTRQVQLFSVKKRKIMGAPEKAEVQGIAMRHQTKTCWTPVLSAYKCQLICDSELAKIAGNAMHLGLIGRILAYGLGTCRKRSDAFGDSDEELEEETLWKF